MQSYVQPTFGAIRIPETHDKICAPLMNDLPISNATLEEHFLYVNLVLERAVVDKFEFKFVKAQFIMSEVTLWVCM